MGAISGHKAAVKITGTAGVKSTGLAATCTTGSGTAYDVVQVDNTARRHWDPDYTSMPKVYRNSTLVTGDRVVNYAQGTVTYTTAHAQGTYTIDVQYLTASSWANAAQWSLNVNPGILQANRFGSTWATAVAGMRSAQASLGGFWTLNDSATAPKAWDYLDSAQRFIVELYPSATAGDRYEGLAWITGNQVGAAADGLVGETVDLTFDGIVSYTTST